MKLTLSAPSKTFLSGEYAVLHHAPGIVLCTEPRFSLTAVQGEQGVTGIPEGSPAMRWLKQREPVWRDWGLRFSDPHAGQGGFGASGAQFLLVHTLTTFLQVSVSRATQGIDLAALWNDYGVLGEGSGVDVIAQATGQTALVERAAHSARGLVWPYSELAFTILRTQHKVRTHDHIRQLDLERLRSLVPLAENCTRSFGRHSAEQFLLTVKDYAAQLSDLGLLAEPTRAQLDLVRAQPWCKAAKGCGAMGADTILVFFAAADAASAAEFIARQEWDAYNTISTGLELHWSWQ